MAQTRSPFATAYKAFLCLVLIALVLAGLMVLRKPAPVAAPLSPEEQKSNAASFNQKVDQLATAQSHHEKTQARLTSDEVNAGLMDDHEAQAASSSIDNSSAVKPAQGLTPDSEVGNGGDIETKQVIFHEDQVTGQFGAQVYGKDVIITVSGRLGSKDGYVTFDPTEFRVGSLSIPVSLVNDELQKKLNEPENREKLRLPPYVTGVRVENGELVIEER